MDERDALLRVEVPGSPPSGNARIHWARRHRLGQHFKNTAYLLLQVAMAQGAYRGWPAPAVDVEYRHVGPGRPPDDDNLIARSKPITDAIVAAGIVVDDDPRHLHVAAGRGTWARRAGTIVVVRRCIHPMAAP